MPDQSTNQVIRLTTGASTSAPAAKPFRVGAPNIVVVVLDDTGFAQLGCYGSDITTPNIDALADRGVRLTNFHTTAVCSPTRACLLTGRNHHRVGFGMLPDLPMRFPGYTARIPAEAATLAEVLRADGYATFAVGKWHLTPRDERSPSGPFENWPLGRGFERFYGFLGGDANHWAPELVRDNTYVDPPHTPDEGYHLSEDLADESIARLRELRRNQADRPFLLWLALGASHAPHHVTPEWSDRYRGQFDDGWEAWRRRALERQMQDGIVPPGTALPEPSPHVPRWEDLDDDHRRVYARMMEVYAGFLSHADDQIGRVIAEIEALGHLDDTIVVLLSDNGASGEGGPHGSISEYRFAQGRDESFELNLDRIDDLGGPRAYNHYPWGWAEAGNTPVRRFKRYTFEGGVRDPMIISWPGGLAAAGEIRHQYAHAVDLYPTLLEMAGVEVPETVRGVPQMSVDGVSLQSMLHDHNADDPRTSQYYECWGSRAMYENGWKVVTNHVNQLTHAERELLAGSSDFEQDRWALFDVHNDIAENHDLGDERPDLRDRLVARWYEEAERNGVLPLSDGVLDRIAHLLLPWPSGNRRVKVRPGERVFEDNVPGLAQGFTITAHLGSPLAPSDRGVIAEQGDYNGGWVWHLDAASGELVFVCSYVSEHITRLAVDAPIGAQAICLIGERDGDTMAMRCDADGAPVGAGVLPHPWPGLWTPNSSATLLIGVGRPLPVYDGYDPTVPFSGDLELLVVEAAGATSFADLDHQAAVAFRSD